MSRCYSPGMAVEWDRDRPGLLRPDRARMERIGEGPFRVSAVKEAPSVGGVPPPHPQLLEVTLRTETIDGWWSGIWFRPAQ